MIKKIEVNDEILYLKKGFTGWNVIYPIKNENGTFNWKNFLIGGNWWRFGTLIGIIILILLAVGECSNAVNVANECLSKNPMIILP